MEYIRQWLTSLIIIQNNVRYLNVQYRSPVCAVLCVLINIVYAVLFVLLLPGLKKQGVLQQQVSVLMSCIAGFIGPKEASPAPQDKKKN